MSERGFGFYQPAFQGYLDAKSQGLQQNQQQIGSMAQLAQIQGAMQDRAMKQQMMPLQMQMLQAQMAAAQGQAEDAARKRQFFSPQNQQQYIEGGRPEISLPEDVQGPTQAAQPGQLNMDRFMKGAAANNVISPEAYYNHLAANETRKATQEATAQARMFELQRNLWRDQQIIDSKNADRASKEAAEARANDTKLEVAKMMQQGRLDAANIAASNRQPPPVTPVTIQDPNDPNKTVVIDGRTKQVLGAGPKLTQTGGADLKLERSMPQAKQQVDLTIQNIDKLDAALVELDKDPGLTNITGTIAGRTPNITNTATGAQAKLNSVKAQVFVEALQAMRNASKTGGAVGNVSDREGDKMERTLAALDQAQSTSDFRVQLNKGRAQLRQSRAIIQKAFEDQYGHLEPSQGAAPAPAGPKVMRFDAQGNLIQ